MKGIAIIKDDSVFVTSNIKLINHLKNHPMNKDNMLQMKTYTVYMNNGFEAFVEADSINGAIEKAKEKRLNSCDDIFKKWFFKQQFSAHIGEEDKTIDREEI